MSVSKIVAAAASGVGGAGLDVDEVFSTYLYDGTGANLTITNGIDLSGEGGLTWIKKRDSTKDHYLFDTARGVYKYIRTNVTDAESTLSTTLTAFNSNGFSLGNRAAINDSGGDYVSWTFRKAPKFFDVVTYTGNSTANTQISHNLGVAPHVVIIKKTSDTSDWNVFHKSLYDNVGTDKIVSLNTAEAAAGREYFGYPVNVPPTDTYFTIGSDSQVNASGATYVAYLFAHNNNDGEFGPDGDADIIKCGSWTADSGGAATIDLGWEPQWVLFKKTDSADDWYLADTMRGFGAFSPFVSLGPNTNAAETNAFNMQITPTGFKTAFGGANTYIYMAIRRGPLAAPDDATKVFSMDTQGSSAPYFDSNHIVDMSLVKALTTTGDWDLYTRLLGEKSLATNTTAAEATASEAGFDFMDGHIDANWGSGFPRSAMWKRAPSFLDVVAYTGNGVQGRNITHNLGVAPDMIWVKNRDDSVDWAVYVSGITHLSVFGSDPDNYGNNPVRLELNTTEKAQFSGSGNWDHTHPTDTVFRVGDTNATNGTGDSLIAYLFATVAGVSKVGSFSLSGSDIDVDCGFSNGARWVMIKRTDGTGNWFQFDTIRGIASGIDSTIYLNTTDDEETADYIDPLSSGFSLVGSAWPSGDYIFYAIA